MVQVTEKMVVPFLEMRKDGREEQVWKGVERGEVKGSLLDIKFEMPFRQPHGDTK